jgi:hypothetical protein
MVDEGQKAPVTIAKGGEIEMIDPPDDSNRLLDVFWEGKPVMMFTIDIRERGEPMSE